MIDIDNIYKRFGNQEILKGASLHIHRGLTRVILGLSGSGKSVLMKHIIGLLQPDAGRILVDGIDIHKLSRNELLQVRRKFGMVFQQSALFDSMTVGDNVAFPLREHTQLNAADIHANVCEKLKMVGLLGSINQYPAELSGGMRKRVALARAIALGAKCLLYDEPTTGLDPLTTHNVDNMILDAKKQLNVTSVVISHDMDSAMRIADYIAVIQNGIIVEDCAVDKIRDSTSEFVQRFIYSWSSKQ